MVQFSFCHGSMYYVTFNWSSLLFDKFIYFMRNKLQHTILKQYYWIEVLWFEKFKMLNVQPVAQLIFAFYEVSQMVLASCLSSRFRENRMVSLIKYSKKKANSQPSDRRNYIFYEGRNHTLKVNDRKHQLNRLCLYWKSFFFFFYKKSQTKLKLTSAVTLVGWIAVSGYVPVKSRLQHLSPSPPPPPSGIPGAFDAFSWPGGREFDHHS